jgi:HEAT repeat protein
VAAAAAIAILHAYAQAPQVAGDLLKSEDAEARRIAVDGIGQKVGKFALADLETAAADPDPKVRRAAIHWLGELEDGAAAGLLAKAVRDPAPAVRAAAASALAKLGPGPAASPAQLVELARHALRDEALAVRLAGIELWAASRSPTLHGDLVALIDDPDPLVAAQAALAAGGGELTQKPIERAAAAADWTTRAGAANLAIRALGKSAALAIARKLAGDSELAVRLAAARVLVHAGDPAAAIAIFVAGLASPDEQLQAAIDLAAQGDERGPQALDAAIRDPASKPTARAAAAAAHRTAHRITPGLVAALADPSAIVRVAAAAAVAVIVKHD